MIISIEKVNESFLNWCTKNKKDPTDVESVEPFFQYYCQKHGFNSFKKIDGHKFQFTKVKAQPKAKMKLVK